MKLREVLSSYDDPALESLAADKVDDVIHLRLPREVLVDEIAGTIASYSYVSSAITMRHPPCFEVLDLLMQAEDNAVPIAGFKASVQDRMDRLGTIADAEDSMALSKDYDLYVRMLEAAWEDDRVVDASESSMLTALRRELGISFREHVVLEHGERIRQYWKGPDAYERERNHLLTAGLLHTYEDMYVLPEELPPLIREVWAIELPQGDYRRLLAHVPNAKLYELLHDYRLKVAGSKDEKIERLVNNYVEPRDLLERLTITELRDVARSAGARISGPKDEVVDNLITFFLRQADLEEDTASEPEPVEPEPKVLLRDRFDALFRVLTIELIHEVASKLGGIPKSGSKRERVQALWESPYCEETLLAVLPNSALAKVLRHLDLPVSGPKDEKTARLMDWAASPESLEATEVEPETPGAVSAAGRGETELPHRKAEGRPDRPKDLEDVEAQFPFLDGQQQTVLAVLRELRSLNEHELERLVARYDLDWFLIKAEMLDLVERLRDNGRPVIRILARGDYNVYEYVGD